MKIKKPTLINLPITEVCDSKCVMCNVWKDEKEDEFRPDILKKKFSDPFYSNVKHLGISGGEPTLNPYLLKNIEIILKELNGLKTLSMTSHGFHTDKHKELLPKIIRLCEFHNVNFGLNISLDGIDDVHLKIRRIKGAFQKTTATAFYAKSIGIPVQFQTTVSRNNVYNVVKVREFAIRHGFESIFRVATEISRLYNENLQEEIALNKKEKSFFADFLDSERTIRATKSMGRRLFYSDLSRRLKTGGNRKAPCSFQSTGLFLSPVGEIYNCSISNTPLKIDENNLRESIESQENENILQNLIKDKCSSCLHDQSGRWKLHYYLKVHDRTRDYYLVHTKIKRIAKLIFRGLVESLKTKNINPGDNHNKVLIIGMYGGEHVGDAAILGGVILRLLKKFNLKEVDVLSIRKDRTECWVENVDIPLPIKVIDNSDVIEPRNYDMLVLAGGPIMNIPSVLYNHLRLINLFKKAKKPFYIEGVGYGPLSTRLSKFLAKKIVRKADYISLRTSQDYNKVKRFRFDSIQTNDPAFDYLEYHLARLKDSKDKALIKILKSKKRICVINLRPMDKTYLSKGSRINSSLEAIENDIVKLIGDYSDRFSFVFMPMNADQFGFSDFEVAYDLERKVKSKGSNSDFIIWETETTINDCLLLLKRASFTISMRFHGCIFSLSTGTPTIGIDYSTVEKGKVYNLFKSLDKEEQVVGLNDYEVNSLVRIAENFIGL